MYLSCCLSVLVISTPRILVSVSRIFLFSKGSSINYIITFGGLGRIIYFIFYCYLIQTDFYQFETVISCNFYLIWIISYPRKGKCDQWQKISVPTSLSDLENLFIWSPVQAINFELFYVFFFKAAYSHLTQLFAIFQSKLTRLLRTLTLTSLTLSLRLRVWTRMRRGRD